MGVLIYEQQQFDTAFPGCSSRSDAARPHGACRCHDGGICGKAGDREQCSMGVLPWALFCGAGAQLVAGVLDYLHKNIFGGTVFCAFGFFWFGVGMSWMIKAGAFGEGLAAGVDPLAIGIAFFAYFLFAVAATIAASSANLFLFVDMVLIDILLLGLSLDAWGIGGHAPHLIAAYAEVAISLLSMYGAGAALLNGFYGRAFWPLGKSVNNWKA